MEAFLFSTPADWTVWQVLRTTDAATMDSGLWWSYAGVLILYTGMTVGAYVVLRSMARRWRAGDEDLPSPYAPAAVAVRDRQREPEPVR